MLIEDRPTFFLNCPRCHDRSYEKLRTHSYCASCNYSEVGPSDELCAIPNWALEALKTVKPKSIVRELRPIEREESLAYAAV